MRVFITSILLLISLSAFSQTPPSIQWQQCYGGTQDDVGYGITATSDGGFLFVGCSGSSDGDILLKPADEQHGGTCDYWSEKIDAYHNTIFKIHLGGTGSDVAYSALETPDGNYIIGGNTGSGDVDVTGFLGNLDFWIVKVNSTPSVIWKKCFGGTNYDDFGSIVNTADGNLTMCGGTSSNDIDVSGNHGQSDFWLVKIDGDGNLLWQKCLGGTGYEKAFDLKQCADGGYILAGFTESNDGDVSGNHSSDYDGWVVKTDVSGNIQWQKCLGGSDQDGFFKVIQLSDQNFMIAGYAYSNNGDISSNHGKDDAWLVLLNPDGNLLWSKTFGGDSTDEFYCLQQDQQGKIVVGGFTKSFNDDVSFNHGGKDYWLLRTDEDGNSLWDTVYGGTYDEVCYGMARANDGGVVLNGYTTSNNDDVSGNHGAIDPFQCKKDYWVVKLESVVGIHEITTTQLTVIPTLAHDVIQISLEDNAPLNSTVVIRNTEGVLIKQQKCTHQSRLLFDVSSFPQGIYFIEINDTEQRAIGKFVKW